MSKYTEGKLAAQGIFVFDEFGKFVCKMDCDFTGQDDAKETAQRLVTCWNEHDDLVKERDELVAVLRRISKGGGISIVVYRDIEKILAKYPEAS